MHRVCMYLLRTRWLCWLLCCSLQETYHALRALEILEQSNVESQKICDSLVGIVQAPHDSVEDAFHVVGIAEVLQCPHGAEVAKVSILIPSCHCGCSRNKKMCVLQVSFAHQGSGFWRSLCPVCKLQWRRQNLFFSYTTLWPLKRLSRYHDLQFLFSYG